MKTQWMKYGSEGGKIRAKKLSARRRSAIAVRAATVRWTRVKALKEITT